MQNYLSDCKQIEGALSDIYGLLAKRYNLNPRLSRMLHSTGKKARHHVQQLEAVQKLLCEHNLNANDLPEDLASRTRGSVQALLLNIGESVLPLNMSLELIKALERVSSLIHQRTANCCSDVSLARALRLMSRDSQNNASQIEEALSDQRWAHVVMA